MHYAQGENNAADPKGKTSTPGLPTRSSALGPRNLSSQPSRPRNFFPLKGATCSRLRARASLAPMRSARELSVKSGYFGFPNLPPPSHETPIHKTREVCDHRSQAVPAEKRKHDSSARIVTEKYRKNGETWILRYRVTASDGRRVENTIPVGLLRDFPKEKDAWREVDKLGLAVRINEAPCPGRIRSMLFVSTIS
jgi:hypothetical protein